MQANVLFIGLEKSDYFRKNSVSLAKSSSKEALSSQSLTTVTICVEQNVVVEGKQLRLKIWNPSGQEQYANLRELSFHAIDSIVIVFSANDPKDCQSLQAYYQQIRRTEQRRNVELFIIPKIHRNNESDASIEWLDQLTVGDSYTEIVTNESGLLERVGGKYFKKLQKAKINSERCCSCTIY